MSSSTGTKYAVRSLARHTRRSILSVAGIGLGCGVCLLLVSFVRGEGEMMMRAAARSGAGHLRVVPAQWVQTREADLRLADGPRLVDKLRGRAGFEAVAPHARTDGLLGFGTRTAGVQMVGVDPQVEPALNRLVREVTRGRYLKPGERGAVVVGKAIADRLDVAVDDDLMVTVSGQGGEMRSAMLRIVGLVSTGSRDLDAGLCHVSLAELAEITGYAPVAEITILLADPERLQEMHRSLEKELPDRLAVVTWAELVPELAQGVKIDETWTNLMVGLVVAMVFLGIASAQLAAALERRREFAVLAALGMPRWRLAGVLVVEGLFLGLTGAAAALALSLPFAWLLAWQGIDFTELYGGADLAVSNVLLDPIIYGDFGWWLVPLGLGLALTATVLSSLYPSWYAVRTDPADALRVEQ